MLHPTRQRVVFFAARCHTSCDDQNRRLLLLLAAALPPHVLLSAVLLLHVAFVLLSVPPDFAHAFGVALVENTEHRKARVGSRRGGRTTRRANI